MYKEATKLKLRFKTAKGLVSVEDLWDIPLKSRSKSRAKADRVDLDSIARDIHNQIKNESDVSFVEEKSSSDTVLELKLNIVKDVIKARLEERSAKANEGKVSAERENIREILARKKNEALENLSEEELEKRLKSLK